MTETEEVKVHYYKSLVVQLCKMLHGTLITHEHEFTNTKLLTIIPECIHYFLYLNAYGKEKLNFSIDKPTSSNSSMLEFSKKAISYLIPNRLRRWNEATREGNPAMPSLVNNLVK